MKRSEERTLRRDLEQRILAGERKSDIVGRAAVDGLDWQTYALLVARIPTPASRRRWGSLNRALVVLVAVTAAAWTAGLATVETGLWLAVALIGPVLLASCLWGLVRFRQRDYYAASSIALVGVWVWLLTIGWHSPGLASRALIAVEVALCGLVFLVALLAVRLLLPLTSMWGNAGPKTDAAGQLRFEE